MGTAVLDIDGTLVDTNYHHAFAWFRAFKQRGFLLPLWRIHRHIGMGGDQLVAALAGDVEKTTPEPDLVLAALEKAGAEPDDAVMIGDSVWDCRAAERAGVRSIGVLTGGFCEDELLDAGAAKVFASVEELRAGLAETPLRV
jgi:phosphoglycolate phosphatase-like HAD superfamily hydrolase